tara:strand:+ start:12774 stop:13232 length:459 start_codon:yes stop_codon:yes gene_type:complete
MPKLIYIYFLKNFDEPKIITYSAATHANWLGGLNPEGFELKQGQDKQSFVLEAIEAAGGSKAEAARRLGVTPQLPAPLNTSQKIRSTGKRKGAFMPKGKRIAAEEIVSKLRLAEVELARGSSIEDVCKKLQISPQSFYRWRKEYGGLEIEIR